MWSISLIKEFRYSSILRKLLPEFLGLTLLLSGAALGGSLQDAERLYLIGDWPKASALFGAVGAEHLSERDLARSVEAALNAGEHEKARKLIGSRGSDPVLRILALSIMAQEGRWTEASEQLEALLDAPGSLRTDIYTALCSIWRPRDYVRALNYCRKALETDDSSFKAWYLLGQLYEDEEIFDEGIKANRQAVRLNPLSAMAHNNLGYAFKERHFYRYAIEEYAKAIELLPDRAGFYYNIGNAYTHEEKIDEAFEAYRKAVELDPDFAKAHYNLGRTYLRKDMPEEAIDEFRRYLGLANGFIFSTVATRSAVESEIEQLEFYLERNPSVKRKGKSNSQ